MQVPGHAKVPHCICPVGCQADLQAMVLIARKECGRGCSRCMMVLEHADPLVAVSDPQFIFCTDHSLRDLSSDLAFLDLERISIIRIQRASDGRNQYGLIRRNIGCSADNGKG